MKADSGRRGAEAPPATARAPRPAAADGADTPRYPRILDMLDAPDRQRLLALASEKTFAKGQFLYHQGDTSDTLFIILAGTVKVLYLHDEGTALTTLYYREGMLVGAHGCTTWSGNHSWTAQAVEDCRMLKIRRADFLEFVRQSRQALYCVLAITEFKGEQLKKVIRVLAQPTLEDKILMAVRHLGALYGLPRGAEIEIEGHITHQEIADMVGASRQSVTTLIVAMEKSGKIRRERRRLFVPAEAAEP